MNSLSERPPVETERREQDRYQKGRVVGYETPRRAFFLRDLPMSFLRRALQMPLLRGREK